MITSARVTTAPSPLHHPLWKAWLAPEFGPTPSATPAVPARCCFVSVMDFAALEAQLRKDVSEPTAVSHGVSTNFVVSLDGRITLEGRSGHMAGPADKTVFKLLRAASDAVVVGVSTAEAEHYGMPAVPPALVELRRTAGLPDQPRLVLASNSGKVHLEHTRFGTANDPRPSPAVMLAVPGAIRDRVAAEYPIFDVIAAGDHEMEPPCLVEELTRLGMPRINCE